MGLQEYRKTKRSSEKVEVELWIIHWGSVWFAFMCFLLGYMTSKTKFPAMCAEFLAHLVILTVLSGSKYFLDYFGS